MSAPLSISMPAEAVNGPAQRAFESGPWPGMKGAERSAILLRTADLIESRLERIARPDALESGKLTDPDGADRNASSLATAECHIEVVEPAGSDTLAVTHLGGTEVVARLRADANIQRGAMTPLAFNLSKSVFFDPTTENRIG